MVTMDSANHALKSLYLGVVAEQLNTSVNPFMTKIEQTSSDVWGKEIRKLAWYGVNGGVGAGSEMDPLPMAGGNNYVQFVSTLKNLYGTIEISDKAMRASTNSTGAFVNLLNAEMEGLIKASKFNFSRMLFGDGSGVLSKVVSVDEDDNNIITIDVNDAKNFAVGMILDFRTAAGAIIPGATGRRITQFNYSTGTMEVDGSQLSTLPAGTLVTIQGSYKNEITGLGAIFGNVASLYGVIKGYYTWMQPYIQNSVGSIEDVKIQKTIDTIDENSGSQADIILCSAGVKRAYQKYLESYKRNVDVLDLKGGFKAISYNGIPLVSDRFIKPGTMYILNSDDFKLHQLCDWKWLESDEGKVLRQIPGKPAYTATLVKYADLMCDRPAGQGMLTGITEA